MDRFVRYPDDPAPFAVGTRNRFRWPDRYDQDVELIRGEVQEGGPGLYILLANSDDKVLVEAYYPEDIRPEFYATQLDPMRQEDFRLGRLVVVGYPFHTPSGEPMAVPAEGIGPMIHQLRKNNRNANRDLRRRYNEKDIARALHEDAKKQEEEAGYEFTEGYIDAWKESRKLFSPKVYGGL
jgi:hypothetical protein